MFSFSIFFVIAAIAVVALATYIVASIAVLFDSRWKLWKRFVPMGAILMPVLLFVAATTSRCYGVLFDLSFWGCLIAIPIFIIWTLYLAWNGTRLADRVLRISCIALLCLILISVLMAAPFTAINTYDY